MKEPYIVLDDYVLIQPDEIPEESVSETGIITSKKPGLTPHSRGHVLGIGPKVIGLKVGQYIMYSSLYYDELEDGLIITREEDVFLVLETVEDV